MPANGEVRSQPMTAEDRKFDNLLRRAAEQLQQMPFQLRTDATIYQERPGAQPESRSTVFATRDES